MGLHCGLLQAPLPANHALGKQRAGMEWLIRGSVSRPLANAVSLAHCHSNTHTHGHGHAVCIRDVDSCSHCNDIAVGVPDCDDDSHKNRNSNSSVSLGHYISYPYRIAEPISNTESRVYRKCHCLTRPDNVAFDHADGHCIHDDHSDAIPFKHPDSDQLHKPKQKSQHQRKPTAHANSYRIRYVYPISSCNQYADPDTIRDVYSLC